MKTVYVVSYIDRVHDCIRRKGFNNEPEAARYAARIRRRACCYADTLVLRARTSVQFDSLPERT